MEPSVLGLAIAEGGPDRKIKLDRSPGLDEVTACFYNSVSFSSLITCKR